MIYSQHQDFIIIHVTTYHWGHLDAVGNAQASTIRKASTVPRCVQADGDLQHLHPASLSIRRTARGAKDRRLGCRQACHFTAVQLEILTKDRDRIRWWYSPRLIS